MPTIIHDLPLDQAPMSVEVRGQRVAVNPLQALVWVSVTPISSASFDPRTPCVPAILDLGFNGSFAIREEHLGPWAGFDARSFRKLRSTVLRGAPADERNADLWIHPNAPGATEASGRPPFSVRLDRSFFVLRPPGEECDNRPRLPLIGVRAIVAAGLRLVLDGNRRRLSIRTAPRFWFFG